jgi:hypothetical protein
MFCFVWGKNPSKTGDTIDILHELSHKYLPVINKHSGEVTPMLMHGDGMTIECIMKSKKARYLCSSEIDNFSNLFETPGEFHKEGLLMQVSDYFHTSKIFRP